MLCPTAVGLKHAGKGGTGGGAAAAIATHQGGSRDIDLGAPGAPAPKGVHVGLFWAWRRARGPSGCWWAAEHVRQAKCTRCGVASGIAAIEPLFATTCTAVPQPSFLSTDNRSTSHRRSDIEHAVPSTHECVMGGAKLEVRPVPLSSVLDWFPTPQAPRSRAQAFKFSLYLAIPIGLTAAVVLRQDVLESIIKSVSSNRLSIQL